MMSGLHFSWDLLGAFGLAAVLAGLWAAAGSGKRVFASRAAVAAALCWLVLEPTVTTAPGSGGKPALLILVDVSRSMGVGVGETRLETVRRILKRDSARLEEDYDVSYYEFADVSARTGLSGIMKARPRGEGTALEAAVEEVSRERKDLRPSVLLFSDGAENASRLPSAPEGPAAGFENAVIYAVGIGRAAGFRDIAVKELRGSDFAFKNRPVSLEATIQNFGYAGRAVPVVLSEMKDGRAVRVAVKEAAFASEAGEARASFRFVPSAPGGMLYRVEVPEQQGEASPGNNARDFRIEVGREKIRVLYLCGQPNPEYAYLRQILKSDPTIELVSFVILRNPENVVPVADEQLSLIPFPTDDIFVRTLPEFDLLIFENFAYSRFGIPPSHLDNIQRFVEDKGGGFLMIGGPNSFGLGGYAGTGIERILPVTVDAAGETVDGRSVPLKALEPQHPVFDLGGTLEETKKIWRNMPPLQGIHAGPGLRPGASLLAVSQEGGFPVLAAWQRRKGRVMAFMGFSSWRWALGLAERGLLESHYSHFWRQAIRWLTTQADIRALRVVLTEAEPTARRKTVVRVLLQPEKLRHPQDAQVSLTVLKDGKSAGTLPLTAVERFEYRAEWTPAGPGDREILAVLRDGSRTLEERKAVRVRNADLEMEDPRPDADLLRQIAERSGGEYFEARDFTADSLRGKIRAMERPDGQQVQKLLWTNPWVFAVLVAWLLGEWGWRRRRGGV